MAREKNLSHKWLGKKSSPKARPRKSINEISVAGGLSKVEPGAGPPGNPGAPIDDRGPEESRVFSLTEKHLFSTSSSSPFPPISMLFPARKERVRPFSDIFPDSDTFYYSDISPDSGSPQIPLESEGTAVPPISKKSEEKARFYSLCPAGAEKKKTRVRGKPVLFLKEKGPGIVKNSPFFPYGKKGPGVGGNIRKRANKWEGTWKKPEKAKRKKSRGPRSPMALPKMACHFRQSHPSSTFLSEGTPPRIHS